MNKGTRALKEFWGEFFASDAYRESAKLRIVQGKSPHLETYLLATVYGRPTEHHEISGPERGPIEFHDHFAIPPKVS